MYLIAKVIVNPNASTKPSVLSVNEIVCSKEELVTEILPKLKRLCEASNLEHRRINSSKRIEFRVTEVADRDIKDYIRGIDNAIVKSIDTYNREITNANLIIKRANKKYSKARDTNIKPNVVLVDYLRPYLIEQSCNLINDVIYVKEG